MRESMIDDIRDDVIGCASHRVAPRLHCVRCALIACARWLATLAIVKGRRGGMLSRPTAMSSHRKPA